MVKWRSNEEPGVPRLNLQHCVLDIAMASRKDPKGTLIVLFRSAITHVKKLLRETGRTLYKKGKTLKRKKGSGRPKKIRSLNRESVTQTARVHPDYRAKDLRNELQGRLDVIACARTVQHSLSDSRYTKKKPNQIPDLTIAQNVGCWSKESKTFNGLPKNADLSPI